MYIYIYAHLVVVDLVLDLREVVEDGRDHLVLGLAL